MVETGVKTALSVPALQASPLVRQYFPSGLRSDILSAALQDPALLYADLDSVCAMGESGLRDLICPPLPGTAGAELAEGSDASPDDEEETSPESAADCVVVTVDQEGYQAKLRLLPPPDGISPPEAKDMLRALARHKITRGVKTEFITRLAERPVYDRTFRIAEARLPVDGQAGSVTYFFNPEVDLSPHMGEDGTADFRDLDFVKSVKAGDLLCRLTPATPGVDGVNVFGRPIPAKAAGNAPVQCGTNTVSSADGLEIRATCDGQVFLRGSTVVVSQILVVDTVDFSTGNIDFPGSVHIQGNVSSGFTVKAAGDIVVQGVVENAVLIAGGNIALCRGVKGAGSGSLDAGQDIRTLFIESCQVRAGGSIYADTILNSDVACGHTVSVYGQRGYLLGGVCMAGDFVSAAQIGNAAQTATSVIIRSLPNQPGQDPALAAALSRYYGAMDQLAALADKDAQDAGGDGDFFSHELARIAVLSRRLESAAGQLQEKSGRPIRPRRRSIQASEALHPNVSLEIDGVFVKNTAARGRCQIYERRQKLFFTDRWV